MAGETIWQRDGYIIFMAGTEYVVYNTRKQFDEGHTHLYSFKAGKDAVNFVIKGKYPREASFYYLTSLQRLSKDKKYIEEIEQLKDVRRQKGKKQKPKRRAGFAK